MVIKLNYQSELNNIVTKLNCKTILNNIVTKHCCITSLYNIVIEQSYATQLCNIVTQRHDETLYCAVVLALYQTKVRRSGRLYHFTRVKCRSAGRTGHHATHAQGPIYGRASWKLEAASWDCKLQAGSCTNAAGK